MIIQGQAGALPSTRQTAGTPNAPAGSFGEILDTKLNPDYYQLVKAGRVYQVGFAAINASAFTGGAAGTPAIGLFNPVASGVDLVVLYSKLAIRSTGTAAVAYDWAFYGVNQGGTAVTGTQTASRNLYSLAATGGAGYAMVNTANTGAFASNLLMPSASGGLTAATAVTNVTLLTDDLRGSIVVAPGCYLAWGQTAALTGASFDGALVWAEIPV